MKKYDLKSIMRMAWNLYRDQEDDEKTFGECLKMAWAHEKNQPERIIASWNALTGEQQMQFLRANVKRAAKDEIAHSTEDHYNEYNESVAWFFRNNDLDGFVNDAWLKLMQMLEPGNLARINERREESGKLNISLVQLVYRASLYSIRAVYRAEVKHVRARVHTVQDKNGDDVQYIDEMATSRKDNTEASAVTGVMLADFINSRDEIDRIIIEGRRDGYSSKEIAQMVGISEPAICKRLKKIKEAGRAAGLITDFEAA